MRKILFIFISILAVLLIAWWGYETDSRYFWLVANFFNFREIGQKFDQAVYQSGTVTIGKNKLKVEMAEAALAQLKGLSWRKSLDPNSGMLFVFGTPSFYSFWMKDMFFPIDIIWISNDQIVDITKNVPVPQGNYLPTYSPSEPVNYVLEINAGYSDSHGIKIGDQVKIEIVK